MIQDLEVLILWDVGKGLGSDFKIVLIIRHYENGIDLGLPRLPHIRSGFVPATKVDRANQSDVCLADTVWGLAFGQNRSQETSSPTKESLLSISRKFVMSRSPFLNPTGAQAVVDMRDSEKVE